MDLFEVADYERVDAKTKRHGRVEQRRYRSFILRACSVAVRWQKAGLCTLLCVVRIREKSGVISKEVGYYVINQPVGNQAQTDELFDTIRGRWAIEVMHNKRDVSLSEDDLRTGNVTVSHITGSLRTLIMNLLQSMNVKNMAAQLDTVADKFVTLIQVLTQQMVL